MKTGLFRCLRDGAVLSVLGIVLVNGFALSKELNAGRFELNDSVLHYTLVDRTVQAIERGENPLDFWTSEWSLGYPVSRTYQVLGHVSLALLYLALGKSISVLTLFIWARYLLVALVPLSVYISARLMLLSRPVAVASAALSPLIATNGLYGLEYGSYLWRGNGLFTQALAVHLLLLTLGFGFRVMRGKSSPILTGLLLGLTFLAHFIYGFIGALSLALLALLPRALSLPKRLVRFTVLGATSFAVAAFQLIPMLLDGWLINHSRWESQWKWDSFGPSYVFKSLLQGDLFDFGRLPVLSLLGLLGAIVCVLKMRKNAPKDTGADPDTPPETYRFFLAGGLLWLLLFCGRSAWGVLFTILGADKLQLHRVLGGVHAFAFFLIGIGLGTLWRWCVNSRFRYRYAAAAVLSAAILFPALRERGVFLQQNAEWSEANLAALRTEENDIKQVVSSVSAGPDRAYSGMAATWGGQFKVGSVPFFAIMSTQHIPAVAFLYHAMALTSDLMIWFDDANPAHYRLFNVATVVAPDSQAVAPFLTAKSSAGRFRVYQAPSNGYFDVVRVPYAARIYPENFYDVNYAWLKSNWVSRLNHVLLDVDGKTGLDLPRLGYGQPLPEVDQANPGFVAGQKRNGETYEATVQLQQPGYLLFKMTYHPRWTALVDGNPQTPVMLTPGFTGVQLNAGRHKVEFRYQPGWSKAVLIIFGLFVLLGAILLERRGGLDWMESGVDRAVFSVRERLNAGQTALALALIGLAAVTLPVCVPLFTSQLVSGHDAFNYVPRLIEFHENIRHGVLLPRWAPDLGSGHGQPLFLFNPPLLYYLAEVWYLAGFEATTSYNIVCVMIVVASAAFMYLLGSLYFGRAGGWLAAVAYIYAPYFHVSLYVRQALAEFTAFPFYPLTLYGFGRFVRNRDPRFLILGGGGLGCIFLAHNAAALLFVPIVGAFVIFSAWSARSLKLFLHLAGGVLLGVGLSAFVWLPVLMEMQNVHVDRLLEGGLKYSNHLVYAHQFFFTNWGFGLSGPGPEDGMSFSLGWSHILLLVAAIVLWRKRDQEERRLIRLFAWIIAAYCFI
ncbi:MAG TPA: glycosyltransferase family 39 protein, partial [Terriglobia bacterium]|nr:glycosyltransferase family 39 protein [Terriglobia bacterium]